MSSDSSFSDLPPSPIRDDDQFLINRDNVSHKINASDLLYYFAGVDFPVDKPCDGDADCPSGQVCFNGYCVSRCNPGDCPEGYVCVDPDGLGNNSYCVSYPFPCDSLPSPDPCPPGYVCVGGFCFLQCITGADCPDGTICTNIDGNDICVPYPFPCPENNVCPPGFTCYNGFCVLTCNGGTCPDGSACIEVLPGESVCLSYPFPCGSIDHILPDKCPPGFYCYAGQCYPLCNGTCDDGFTCTPIGNEDNNEGINGGPPISICLPDPPSQGLINDGKLNIVDDQNNRRIIFSANQYGDTFLKISGIDIDSNGGSNGGGAGSGDLVFNTLWKRTDPTLVDSDIEPTYSDVDILPHGVISNIGSDAVRWNELHIRDVTISRTLTFIENPFVSGDPTWDPNGVVHVLTSAEVLAYVPTPEKIAAFGGVLPYLPKATDDQKGVVELATCEETTEATRNDLAVTPAGLNCSGVVPMGGIIMWSGTDSTIPDNWALCDGSTVDGVTTPDLRDRFVYGAYGSKSPHDFGAATGSGSGSGTAANHALVPNEIPRHQHSQYGVNGSAALQGGTDGSWLYNIVVHDPNGAWTGSGGADTPGVGNDLGGAAHKHSVSVSVSISSCIPDWYALAFIMRLK